MPTLRRWTAILLLLTLGAAQAQTTRLGGAADQVTFSAEVVPKQARPGETVELRVKSTIAKGWHIYSLTPLEDEFGPQPTTLTLTAGDLTPIGEWKQPKPLRKMDSAFEMEVESFENEATFTRQFRVSDTAKVGEASISVKARFMVCNERTCLPPTTVEVLAKLTVLEGKATAQTPATPTPKPSVKDEPTKKPTEMGQPPAETPKLDSPAPAIKETPDSEQVITPQVQQAISNDRGVASRVSAARAQGFWAYFGFAISMGFLALLTPCVFPMIPITVSFFTKKEGLTRVQGLAQALIYCGGIIATFTGLGIVLALAFGAASIQALASNVYVNFLIAGIFVVFALNLFGAFEIQVPYQLLGFLGAKSGSGTGTVATLLMGLTFSLTSFTCTVPFVGTVLVAATQGELFWAMTGMLGFSAAFASPFFLLALFPQLLGALPKSGGWLNSIKVVMGFLELAAAMKFLSNIDLVWNWGILSRELFLAVWVAIALVAAVYLLGKIRLPHDTSVEGLGVVRMLWSVLFFSIAFYLLTGLLGKPLGELDAFLPPYSTTGETAVAGVGAVEGKKQTTWLQSYDEALAEAKTTRRPIFIDFTGVTCTNCRWMEKNVFARPDVGSLLERYVRVQLWTDKGTSESEANQRMQNERFGTVALPFYALIAPDDTVIATFDGLTRKPEEFKAFLQDGLDRSEAQTAAY